MEGHDLFQKGGFIQEDSQVDAHSDGQQHISWQRWSSVQLPWLSSRNFPRELKATGLHRLCTTGQSVNLPQGDDPRAKLCYREKAASRASLSISEFCVASCAHYRAARHPLEPSDTSGGTVNAPDVAALQVAANDTACIWPSAESIYPPFVASQQDTHPSRP